MQRYQDALYITSVSKTSKLRVGDKIICVDDLDIKDFAKQHEAFLFGEIEERQAPHWEYLLKSAKKTKDADC